MKLNDAGGENMSDEQVAQYWERGYWVSEPLFTAAEVEQLRRAHERLWRGDFDHAAPSPYGLPRCEQGSAKVRQLCNAFWLNDDISRAVRDPRIGAIAARLMGVDHVRLWHDQAIWKPGLGHAGAGEQAGNIGWHQDYGYWRASSTTNMCTAWIALQDTDLHNGGMRTIVGSHRWGLIEDSAAFFDPDLAAQAERFSKFGEWLDEPCIIPAGAVSFHHALTFHGSGPNLSHEPRLSLVSHLMPEGTRYRAGHGWHENVVFLGPRPLDGTPFDGPWWPRLV